MTLLCLSPQHTCMTDSMDSEYKPNFVSKKINKTFEHHLIMWNHFDICKSAVKYFLINGFQDSSVVKA